MFWTRIINRIKEPYSGAWQLNDELSADDGLSYPVVFACVTRIADDISKVPLRIESRDSNGIYRPERNSELTRLLKRPNAYQTRQQFIAQWESSIQSRGNAYILKSRSGNKVEELHVLNPDLVMPMVSPSGAVYYRLDQDNITGIGEERIVPASEIIHDRINCLFHPLVGLSPLYAAALNVWLGKRSQEQQQQMFANGATPGGILIFPGNLDEEKAKKLHRMWNSQYTGENVGKTAVLGDGVTYQRLGVPAEDAQLIEQLKFGATMICAVFHVPPYKIGVGDTPPVNDIEGLNQVYFSDCIQTRMTGIQNVLNASFGLENSEQSFRFELDSLILMDTKSRAQIAVDLRKGGLTRIDESRRRMNYGPIPGGDDIYLQQQDHSLRAIQERDKRYIDGAPVDTAPGSSDTATDDGRPVSDNIQQEALNGAQVTALRDIVMSVAAGSLPRDVGANLIAVAFPLITQEQIDNILAGVQDIDPDMIDEEIKMYMTTMATAFEKGYSNERTA